MVITRWETIPLFGQEPMKVVVVNEPGIYLTGWGGVRIEDVVVLENGRARIISKARKESP